MFWLSYSNIDSHVICGSVDPHESAPPHGISIGSAIFAGLAILPKPTNSYALQCFLVGLITPKMAFPVKGISAPSNT